jgi:hypothetical protein
MKKETYHVEISKLKKHIIPPLLKDFSKWLATQTYGAVGYFDFIIEEVPNQITEDTELRKNAFSFIHQPDGSIIVLHNNGSVINIDSEGGNTPPPTVARTLEEFLLLLAEGNTQINDLDESKPAGRKVLKKWLEEKKIVAKTKSKETTGLTKKISYKDFEVALGKTLESDEMKALLQKLGNPTPRYNSRGRWTLPQDGMCIIFDLPDDKPFTKKNENFLFFSCVQLFTKSPQNGIKSPFMGELPDGIHFGDTPAEVRKKLGKPKVSPRGLNLDIWDYNKLSLSVHYKIKEITVEMVALQIPEPKK